LGFKSPEDLFYKGFVTFSVTSVTFCNYLDVTKKAFEFRELTSAITIVTDVTSIIRYTRGFWCFLWSSYMGSRNKFLRGIYEKAVTNVTNHAVRCNPLYLNNSFVTPGFEKTLQEGYKAVTKSEEERIWA